MMKRFIHLSLGVLMFVACTNTASKNDFTTLFETSEGTETPTYQEVIAYYTDLTAAYDELQLFEIGMTDSGEPLHLVVFNADKSQGWSELHQSSKNRVLINNGIHPGESDGIDASMMFLRDIVQNDSLKNAYKNTLIAVIPVYNVGGALQRNSHSRTNQNGPKAYGFRGNARNYDLNRDFIKQDTKNAATFASIYHAVQPDVFIDNHVSNGADYQYAITHLFTQHNKLGGDLGAFLESEIRPALEQDLAKKGIPITPYVNVWGGTPKQGWAQFYDSPRYSTGYTTLFNTLGMMVETHMLKPYKTRVTQTYELMASMMMLTEKHSSTIKKMREHALASIFKEKTYPIAFEVNREQPSYFQFLGYEGSQIDSKVTNGKRLFYDRNKPYTDSVAYYNTYVATKSVSIPKAYILEQGWHNVVERLQANHIQFTRFEKDTILTVQVNHVLDFKTRPSAYEGHYLHYNTTVQSSTQSITFRKGDLYIPTQQSGLRYLLETLEAEAVDSFFNWNFFDTVLQQKEGYSAYVFEDIAERYLKEDATLKDAFDTKLANDPAFAKNPRAQLDFIFKNSPHYEKAHLKLPVYQQY